MSQEALKLALEAYCKTLHPLWNTGISRTEAEGFFNAGFKAAEALTKQEQSEPVAWRTFDGEGFYFYCSYEGNENYADVWNKRNPNHKGWVEPLYNHQFKK